VEGLVDAPLRYAETTVTGSKGGPDTALQAGDKSSVAVHHGMLAD
jgi:hypothetical protein